MKRGFLMLAALATASVLACANRVEAATISVLNDTGDLDVITATQHSRTALTNLYGTAPVVPAITQTSNTSYEIDFAPTASFNASAYALPSGQTSTFDGSLDIIVTFSAPIQLTTNIFEDGVFNVTGNGKVNVTGGVTVWAVDPLTHVKLAESRLGSFGNPTINNNGTWTLADQVTGFTNSYSAYMIHVDNVLVAQSLLSSPAVDGSAWIAKKDFTLVLTTDGSGGNGIPEPASLSILALGGVALLARRRRA
jgi:hypothetical protein